MRLASASFCRELILAALVTHMGLRDEKRSGEEDSGTRKDINGSVSAQLSPLGLRASSRVKDCVIMVAGDNVPRDYGRL